MCIIFRKLTIACYERKFVKKKEFIGEKDSRKQMLVTILKKCSLQEKYNILNLLER